MTTTANQYRPNRFADFIGQGNGEGGEVDLIKKLIQHNSHELANFLILTGPSGSSKSTLARLYAQATLCHNREEGDYEACGYCDICTGKSESNIYAYTITSSPEAREPLKKLVDASYGMPINFGVRADQFRQFIIIDELQNATPELICTLLTPLEHCPKTTTWIFNTMDLEKLHRRDPITYEAITSRAMVIKLKAFTEDEVAAQLIRCADFDEDTAYAIAAFSHGNMREAWSLSTKLNLTNPDKPYSKFTSEEVYNLFGGGANEESRLEMWRALYNGNLKEVLKIFNNWIYKGAPETLLSKLLIEDLLESLTLESKPALELITQLAKWSNSATPFPLSYVFLPFGGQELVRLDPVVPQLRLVETKKVTGLDLIKQASEALGIELKPPFFTLSITELLRHYAVLDH